eukprot:Em0003g446a
MTDDVWHWTCVHVEGAGGAQQLHHGGHLLWLPLGKQSGHHFNTADLETMGRHLCDTLLEYCDPDRTKMQQVLREVEEDYRKEVVERLVAMGRAVPKGVDPLDIVLEPEESRCFGGGVWK